MKIYRGEHPFSRSSIFPVTFFVFSSALSHSACHDDFKKSHEAEVVKAPLLEEEDREVKASFEGYFRLVRMKKDGNCMFASLGWGDELLSMIEVICSLRKLTGHQKIIFCSLGWQQGCRDN